MWHCCIEFVLLFSLSIILTSSESVSVQSDGGFQLKLVSTAKEVVFHFGKTSLRNRSRGWTVWAVFASASAVAQLVLPKIEKILLFVTSLQQWYMWSLWTLKTENRSRGGAGGEEEKDTDISRMQKCCMWFRCANVLSFSFSSFFSSSSRSWSFRVMEGFECKLISAASGLLFLLGKMSSRNRSRCWTVFAFFVFLFLLLLCSAPA